MPITHSEALRLASEARNRGDRAENRKYSAIARDLADRRTSGEDTVDYFDTQTNRIVHSPAGSDIYVGFFTGESDRYIPVNEEQIKDIRRQIREQQEAGAVVQPEIRFQTVRDSEGNILYTLEPGSEPGTILITHPGQDVISPPPSSKWVVTYDLGRGERSQTFDTEQEAQSFSDSLTDRANAQIDEKREQFFTLSGGNAFIDYLRSIGPPEPTEEQRARQEAGIPVVGIPGPALTKPGSVKEILQNFAKDVVAKTEVPFKAITDPLRKTSRVLDKLSLDVLKTDVALQPPVQLGSQTVIDFSLAPTLRVPSGRQPLVGTAAYLASLGVGVLATGIDVATFEIRPGLVIESIKGVKGLVFEPEVREAVVSTVAQDPFRFVVDIVGGALVGQQIKLGLPKAESQIRQFMAKRSFDKLTVADQSLFSQFEREINLDFPEEVVESTTTRTLFKRGELKVLNDVDLIVKKIPFFIETSPEVEKLLVQALPDEFELPVFKDQPPSFFALPFDEKGGAILVRGKAGMTPFAEASIPLPPRSEAVSILTTKPPSVTKPPSMSLKPVSKLFTATMETESIFHFPSVDLRATLATAAKAAFPSLPSLVPSITISSLLSIPVSVEKVKDVAKQIVVAPQALKQILDPINIQEPSIIQVPKPIQFQFPVPTQVQVPFQIPIQIQTPIQVPIQIQTPIQVPIQIQIPTINVPVPTFPTSPPPEPSKRIKIPGRKKKKKKKKKTQKNGKGVFELRVDKIAKNILKVLKI